MSICPACDASLQKAHQAGSPWDYCSAVQCADIANYLHTYCYCQGQFSVYPFVQNGVCMNSGTGTLVPIAMNNCYCCCGCTSAGTPIAVSANGVKAAHEFNINDQVLVAKDASLKTWLQKPVLFSSGIGAQGQTRLITIHFGDQKTGAGITPQSFVSETVTLSQAESFYKILSKAPNNFIDENGFVNLDMLNKTGAETFSMLLSLSADEAEQIYQVLKADPNYLLATTAQPFLMKDGSLKQAEKLVPGRDLLMRKDGSTVPIISVNALLYEKSVHQIATTTEKATSLDGHLLLANGIVIGDYATQISMSIENSPIADKYRNDPAVGTKEYNLANTQLMITPTGAHIKTE